jgi:hypothetical protein
MYINYIGDRAEYTCGIPETGIGIEAGDGETV